MPMISDSNVSDWSTDQFDDPEAMPPLPGDDDGPTPRAAHWARPAVNVGEERDQLVTTLQVRDILRAANAPPSLFVHGRDIVRVAADDFGVRFSVLDEVEMLGHLRATLRPVKWRKPKTDAEAEKVISPDVRLIEVDAPMPLWIAKAMLDSKDPVFPPLDSIVTAPTLALGGRLVMAPGYDEVGRLWYAPPAGFHLPPVPPRPTENEVAEAKRLLFEHWLGDFKFSSSRDKAHAMALLFAPFVRPMIDGPTPMHLVEASAPGTGKTLLPELFGLLFLGKPPGLTSLPTREEEIAKQIATDLGEGAAFIFFDNVKGMVKSAALEHMLTADAWRARILGVNKNAGGRVRVTCIMTANNPQLGEEMARRSVRIRLDTEATMRQGKAGYRIPDILKWTKANRPKLVHAVLTLLSSWLAAGMPNSPTDAHVLRSFEAWSTVMSSLLGHLGIPALLTTDENDADDDVEGGEALAFCEAWHARFEKGAEVRASDLLPVLKGGHLGHAIGDERSDRGYQTALGTWLNRNRDREFGAFRIERTSSRPGHLRYKVTHSDTQNSDTH